MNDITREQVQSVQFDHRATELVYEGGWLRSCACGARFDAHSELLNHQADVLIAYFSLKGDASADTSCRQGYRDGRRDLVQYLKRISSEVRSRR